MMMFRRNNHLVTSLTSTCRKSSTSSSTSYPKNCPFRFFAKTHPEAARLVLQPPSFPFRNSASNLDASYEHETLTKYLTWRGWDHEIKQCLNEHNLNDQFSAAVGLLSHPLTFPLTMARHAEHFVRRSKDITNKQTDNEVRKYSRVCCIGARSECSLPDDYWREFLVVTSARDSQNNLDEIKEADKTTRPSQSFEWIIDFVGPDVPKNLTSKSIFLFTDPEASLRTQYSLTMNYHTSFLHDLILRRLKNIHSEDTQTTKISGVNRLDIICQYWDGFVLFNPGIGHPNLAKQWESTVKFLLRTNKPMLVTAHSQTDAARDLRVIKEKMFEERGRHFSDGYRLNPFASRMEFIDPFATKDESVHIVWPNHSVLFLPST